MTGFLFDNDGVLIDTTELHWLAWQKLMEEDPSLRMTRAQFTYGFGKTNKLIMDETMPDASVEQKKRWAERKEELFRALAKHEVEIIHGMEHFLQKVQEANIPHIIASSTPLKNLEMYLEATHLGKYFDYYISGEEVAQGKPAPDIFIAAAHRLGLDPHDCVVFEDAPAGVLAARAAGCFVVALETSHPHTDLPTYDLVYPSPEELDLEEILVMKEKMLYKGRHG
ncbi:MAG: HAD family phosphatase [Chlamydiales bacterium]|nr:HAD family phosphatase [Chlamydiales bacterium]